MDKNKFLALFDDKIKEVANQDSVRAATLQQEIQDGTMDITVDNALTVVRYTLDQSLKSGFTDDQAFFMACKMAGIEIEAPYAQD